MDYEIKELGLGEILDQALNVVKDHFMLFMAISGFFYFPFTLVQNIVMEFLSRKIRIAQQDIFIVFISVSIFFTIVMLCFIYPLTNAAIITALARKYQGRDIGAAESLKGSFSKIFGIIWTTFLAYVIIMVGFFVFIIPGILLSLKYALTTHVVVLEDTSGWAALKRSWKLTKKNMGKVFVLYFLITIISLMIQGLASLIPVPYLSSLVMSVLQIVIFIFSTAVIVVFYFSCRCQHENFDLTLLAHKMADGQTEADRNNTQKDLQGGNGHWD